MVSSQVSNFLFYQSPDLIQAQEPTLDEIADEYLTVFSPADPGTQIIEYAFIKIVYL
jgi:hypothetical protein